MLKLVVYIVNHWAFKS